MAFSRSVLLRSCLIEVGARILFDRECEAPAWRGPMGGFYGSVQVKTHDRDAVRAAVEAVAAAQGIRCYLGPALDGWVGAYPQFNGQDASFGEEVASRLDAPVLHLMVHDDDIFSYEFWDGGQHVDSYWSRPGYFGE